MSEPAAGHGRRVVFVGAVHEAEPALAALLAEPVDVVEVITVPDDPGRVLSGQVDLAPLARAGGVPLRRCADINDTTEVAHLRLLAPDLLVVVGWTRLIGAQLLGVPGRGTIGFHASLLPRYRGRAPVNWAIIRGETETGNTMMYLDAGTDTGDVVDQRRVPVGPDDTCADVYAAVAAAGADMLRTQLPALLDGTAPRRRQGPSDGEVLPKRTPAMGVTDWARPAGAVHDWVRALTAPYPGAFSLWAGRKVMLWGSEVGGAQPAGAAPGQVLDVGAEGVSVATGTAALQVTSVSDPGGPAVPAAAWARASSLAVGDRFDPVDEATSRWALGRGVEPAAALAG